MRYPVSSLRSSKLSQVAFVALASAAVAGCSSDITRFGDSPTYTGSTDNQRRILGGTSQPMPSYSADTTGSIGAAPPPVHRVDLPPAPAPQSYAAPQATLQPPRVAAQPVAAPSFQPPSVQPPIYQAPVVQAPTVQAPGWSGSGTTVVLAQGETVDTLSRRYGVPTSAILSANNFADASRVQPGTRVVIPTYSLSAPQAPKAPLVTGSVTGPRVQVQPPQVAVQPPRIAAQPPRVAAVAPVAVTVPQAPGPVTVTGSIKTPAVAAVPVGAKPTAIVVPPPTVATSVTGTKVGPHVVKPGENLERIANSYGITKAKLMEANGLKTEQVRAGQQLKLPSGAVLRVAKATPAPAAAPAPVAAAPVAAVAAAPLAAPKAAEVAKAPVQPVAPAKAETKTAALTPAPAAAPAEHAAVLTPAAPEASAGRGEAKSGTPSFRWPVRGRIIKEFGTASGERNDGINLAVPEGTSVKAAEDGEVIYSGNELKGYGNLVLVKHQDGWVTAYAHASELLVNRGDKITRGQIIARAGATGGVSQPQLHFEIRKGQRPIDPKQFLTSN